MQAGTRRQWSATAKNTAISDQPDATTTARTTLSMPPAPPAVGLLPLGLGLAVDVAVADETPRTPPPGTLPSVVYRCRTASCRCRGWNTRVSRMHTARVQVHDTAASCHDCMTLLYYPVC